MADCRVVVYACADAPPDFSIGTEIFVSILFVGPTCLFLAVFAYRKLGPMLCKRYFPPAPLPASSAKKLEGHGQEDHAGGSGPAFPMAGEQELQPTPVVAYVASASAASSPAPAGMGGGAAAAASTAVLPDHALAPAEVQLLSPASGGAGASGSVAVSLTPLLQELPALPLAGDGAVGIGIAAQPQQQPAAVSIAVAPSAAAAAPLAFAAAAEPLAPAPVQALSADGADAHADGGGGEVTFH
jgi:hypothetical protein